ncbi:MAG: hypothetical protein ACPL7E_00015 [bacterium]
MQRCLFLFFFLFLASLSLYGARANISMDLQVGFKGVVYSRSPYTIIWATLTNNGDSPFKGFIGIVEHTLIKVELQSGERKRYLYLASGMYRVGQFSLFSEKKKVIFSLPLPSGVVQEEPLQLILPAREIDSLPWLVGIDVEDFPDDWRALSGVELLMVEGSVLDKLNREQRRNLLKWVELGGRIMIVGSESLKKELGNFTRDLLPIRDIKEVHLPYPPISFRMMQIPIEPHPVTIYTGTPFGGEVIWEADGYPLLVARRHGWGVISFLAFQPWARPFNNWQGLALLLPPPSSKRIPFLVSWEPFPFSGLSEWSFYPTSIAKGKAIPFSYFLIFSLVFVYLFIPSIYIVLRITRRTSYYWVVMLSIIFIVCLAIFLFGRERKEKRIAVKELVLNQIYPDGKLINRMGILGIYSPHSANFSLKFREKDIVVDEVETCGQARGFFYMEDGTKKVKEIVVPRWGMRTYQYSLWTEGQSPLTVELAIYGDEIRGWIQNTSNCQMRNTYLIFGQKAYSVGSLKSGERKRIVLNMSKSCALSEIEFGDIYFFLESLFRQTPSASAIYPKGGGKRTVCALIWEGKETPTIGEINPQPRLYKQKALYAQFVILPEIKLTSKVPFLCLPTPPFPIHSSEEAPPSYSSLFRIPCAGSPFFFSGYQTFYFIPSIEGLKFSKVFIDIEMESESKMEISLSLRRAKKTHEIETVKKAKIPGHLTYVIDKPDEFLLWGKFIFATLETKFPFLFNTGVTIKNFSVYGIPKGG